jgi:DNA-binding beta-propeller fold protein YncE
MTAGSNRLTVALGDRHYRVERPWGQWPDRFRSGLITDVAVDSADNVYVYQRYDTLAGQTGPAITVFDPEGLYLRHWGDGLIADAHMLCIAPDDRVFLVDRDAHQILACDPQGALLFTLGERHRPNTPFNHPTDIAVALNGAFYVSDGYGNAKVHWFAADGELRRSWGQPGSGPGEFTTPHGICVLGDGRVLVGDRENNRIQVFSPEGEFIAAWGDFYHPMDIHADAEGLVYVSDQVPRLTLLDNDGNLVGCCRPVLNGGHGVCGDSGGNIYLAELNPSRISRLRRETRIPTDR